MQFLPLGVGDAFSALHYSSCLAVEAEGSWLLVDCPHPVRKMLREAARAAKRDIDIGDIGAVALTHLHADHASGLESYAFFCKFVLGRRAVVVTHHSVASELWDGHLASGMRRLVDAESGATRETRLEDFFEVLLVEEDSPVEVGPFTIECHQTRHHVPTIAFRVTAGGRSLGYSADTSYDEGLIEWLAKADIAVHETNFGVHTPYAKLARLPAELRRRMRLIHYPDEFDISASAIQPLNEGRLYRV